MADHDDAAAFFQMCVWGGAQAYAMLPVGVDWMYGLLSDVYLAQHDDRGAAGKDEAATDTADVVAASLAAIAQFDAILPDVVAATDDGPRRTQG